jgi:hypothetical protein
MNKFIEVYGESQYQEYPVKVVMDIDISVRATTEEKATEDIREVVNKTLDSLFQSGIERDEVSYGGREVFTPWWKRNKAGLLTRNKISIVSGNRMTVYKALEEIDQFKNDKRIMVEISERQPIFEPLPEDVDSAISEACQDAKAKAEKLAKATGVSVGNPLEIEEFKRGTRGSGSYGDYDYGDYQGITIASAAAVGAGDISKGGDNSEVPPARIEGNRRTIFVKYRIKYEIE